MSQESNYLAGTGDAALEETLRGAEEMLNSGDLIEAERAFRSVLREHPDNASALRAMGRTAEQGDRKEEALDYFSRAYHTDQDSADFMADLSRIYLKLGNQEMAEH